MSSKISETPAAELPLRPHVLFFLVYNALYFIPLMVAYVVGYEEGGVGDVLLLRSSTLRQIWWIYLAGISAFLAGSFLPSFLSWCIKGKSPAIPKSRWLKIGVAEKTAMLILCVVFLASKVSLIPLGVYHAYAFDTDSMTGGLWSFSMFCSEAMVLAGIVVLFSKERRRLLGFLAISTLNGINLLHGTRIFFMSTVMVLVLYGYVRGKLTLRRIVLYGPVLFAFVLLIAYAIFLSRSAAAVNGATSFAAIVSPVVYESVFSQMSLIGILDSARLWATFGQPLHFVSDLIVFAMPRFLLPDKDSALYIARFSNLSPLGAFSGYAQGLIYFGVLFPVFYFVMGYVGSYLHKKSGRSPWWFGLYIFFTADFLLHIMRDGYLIPLKMLINTVELVLILVVWKNIVSASLPQPVVTPPKPSPIGV